jgi:hypothetical protein
MTSPHLNLNRFAHLALLSITSERGRAEQSCTLHRTHDWHKATTANAREPNRRKGGWSAKAKAKLTIRHARSPGYTPPHLVTNLRDQ